MPPPNNHPSGWSSFSLLIQGHILATERRFTADVQFDFRRRLFCQFGAHYRSYSIIEVPQL